MQSNAITDKNGGFFDSIGQSLSFGRLAPTSVHVPISDIQPHYGN
jgi:hypothetical protein